METITINGIAFYDFGTNNIVPNVHLIMCYHAPYNMVQRVLNKEFPNVWLNPSVRCDKEFYGFLCSEKDYQIVKQQQQESQKAKLLLKEWDGVSLEDYHRIQDKIEKDYKDWWE